jgi:hypothetical protein
MPNRQKAEPSLHLIMYALALLQSGASNLFQAVSKKNCLVSPK